jgi:hypothetical protein
MVGGADRPVNASGVGLRSLCEGRPIGCLPLPARPVRVEDRLLPTIQMHVLGGPGQHGKRHAEIVVLPRRAFIDDTAVVLLGLERHELLISVPAFRGIRQADLLVTQFGEQQIEQKVRPTL